MQTKTEDSSEGPADQSAKAVWERPELTVLDAREAEWTVLDLLRAS